MREIKNVTITPEILKLIADIDEFKGRWTVIETLAPERLTSLRRIATIESVGSSTRIEGATLSDAEVEKLLAGLPKATNIAYTGTPIEKTEHTFGAYIDYYTMEQAQKDQVTLEIVYEGRTHSASVFDTAAMDARFQDVFSDYRISERLRILGYGTRDAYLDAVTTIEAKARDAEAKRFVGG